MKTITAEEFLKRVAYGGRKICDNLSNFDMVDDDIDGESVFNDSADIIEDISSNTDIGANTNNNVAGPSCGASTSSICCVCLTEKKSVMFLACKHVATCEDCWDSYVLYTNMIHDNRLQRFQQRQRIEEFGFDPEDPQNLSDDEEDLTLELPILRYECPLCRHEIKSNEIVTEFLFDLFKIADLF